MRINLSHLIFTLYNVFVILCSINRRGVVIFSRNTADPRVCIYHIILLGLLYLFFLLFALFSSLSGKNRVLSTGLIISYYRRGHYSWSDSLIIFSIFLLFLCEFFWSIFIQDLLDICIKTGHFIHLFALLNLVL